MPRRVSASRPNACGKSPPVMTGKSSVGRVCRVKRERPLRSSSRSSSLPSSTCAPSGSLRTMSYSVCAGAVVDPSVPIDAGDGSRQWRYPCPSRSGADVLPCASIRTLDRIGMVFRRSTTLWTWFKERSSSARSMVSFMGRRSIRMSVRNGSAPHSGFADPGPRLKSRRSGEKPCVAPPYSPLPAKSPPPDQAVTDKHPLLTIRHRRSPSGWRGVMEARRKQPPENGRKNYITQPFDCPVFCAKANGLPGTAEKPLGEEVATT